MTETPVERLIVSLSIPTIITMLVTNIYKMADTAFAEYGKKAFSEYCFFFKKRTDFYSVHFNFKPYFWT